MDVNVLPSINTGFFFLSPVLVSRSNESRFIYVHVL